jgi:hypothetical protein
LPSASLQQKSVSRAGHPFRARQMGIERASRSIGLRVGVDAQQERPIKLELHTTFPLFVRHMEQIDAEHDAGDV